MCFGCSKEQSHRDGSFEQSQHMFWLRNKKQQQYIQSGDRLYTLCFRNQRTKPISLLQAVTRRGLHRYTYEGNYLLCLYLWRYSKTCLKRPFKNRQKKDLNDKWLLNEVGKYCRMLSLEHSAILLTCIKQQSVLKPILVFFLSGHLRQILL